MAAKVGRPHHKEGREKFLSGPEVSGSPNRNLKKKDNIGTHIFAPNCQHNFYPDYDFVEKKRCLPSGSANDLFTLPIAGSLSPASSGEIMVAVWVPLHTF